MTDCLLFVTKLNKDGYGLKNGKLAHRLIWEETNGVIPPGICVCHECDVRNCINISHLFLGTRADNNRDMMQKGRGKFKTRKGEKVWSSKLTEAQVNEIRLLYNSGAYTHLQLAKQFNVGRSTITELLIKKTWKD